MADKKLNFYNKCRIYSTVSPNYFLILLNCRLTSVPATDIDGKNALTFIIMNLEICLFLLASALSFSFKKPSLNSFLGFFCKFC